jgi:hypothetical protein
VPYGMSLVNRTSEKRASRFKGVEFYPCVQHGVDLDHPVFKYIFS